MWNQNKVEVKVLQIDKKYIHAEVYGLDQVLQYMVTIIYALNQIEKRNFLWK